MNLFHGWIQWNATLGGAYIVTTILLGIKVSVDASQFLQPGFIYEQMGFNAMHVIQEIIGTVLFGIIIYAIIGLMQIIISMYYAVKSRSVKV